MTTRVKIILSAISTAAIAFGIFIAVNVHRLMQYCYKITKYKLEGVDNKYIYLKFLLAVKNKSDLDIGISGYFIKVLINNKLTAIISSDKPKILAGRKTSNLELPVKIEYKKIFDEITSENFLNDFMEKRYEKIFISLEGKFIGKFMRIKIRMPVNLKMSLKEIIENMDKPSEPC